MKALSDDELFDALGLELKTADESAYTPREEHLLAGFEEIAHFFTTHGRAPQHGASDIFERLYAVRLDRLRALPEARELLAECDAHGLLSGALRGTDARVSSEASTAACGQDARVLGETSASSRDNRVSAGVGQSAKTYRFGRATGNAGFQPASSAASEASATSAISTAVCGQDARVPGETSASNDDAALLAELGVDLAEKDDIMQLHHVRSKTERRLADEVAERIPCKDFAHFKSLFAAVQSELKNGLRQSRPFEHDASVVTGNFFILGGLLTYVAETGDDIKAPNGANDARLRVIYSNGTESNLLRRSLKRALHKDETSRRLSEPDPGPLFSGEWDAGDIESGTIYVLQSLSDHPYIAAHRELVHKIGVTGGSVETRIAGAIHEATYLLAEVKVVASYKLSLINRTKLEKLFHRLFASAQLELTIMDRFGNPVQPREWFLVPLPAIDDAVERIRDGSIPDWVYDQNTARLVKKDSLVDSTIRSGRG